MKKTKPKLIIWDYDGVLSDSEKLWIKIWQDLINEKFGLGWDFETADQNSRRTGGKNQNCQSERNRH